MQKIKNRITQYFIISTLLFIGISQVKAQGVELGARFMPTFTNFKIYTPQNGSVKGDIAFGYGFGALVGYNFTKNIELQGEVLYSAISQKYKDMDAVRKINLRYINIPILFSVNTSRFKVVNVNFVVGPQIGISVGSDVSTTNNGSGASSQGELVIKKGDLGFAYGAGVDFGLNTSRSLRLGLGFRGVYGLIDISDHSKTVVTGSYYLLDRAHIQTYSAYIGLTYLFGKEEKK